MNMNAFSCWHKGFSAALRSFVLTCLLGIALAVALCPAIAHAEGESSPSAADALELNKTATANDDGTYTITLESYATAAVEAVPTDVVLLLDRSGSMYDAAEIDTSKENNGVYMTDTLTYEQLNALSDIDKSNGPQQAGYYMMARAGKLYCIQWDGSTSTWVKYDIPVRGSTETARATNYKKGTVKTYREDTAPEPLSNADKSSGIYYKSIFGVSYDGVRTFLDEVSGASNMRVAIVGFGGYAEKDWAGTGFYYGGVFCSYKDYQYDSDEFKGAFRSVDDATELQELYDSLKIYEPAINQTATGAGFRIAEELFDLTPNDEAKNVVVIFTDGEPTGTPPSNAGTSEAKTHAINRAEILKGSKYKAEIYAIGPQGGSASVEMLEEFASSPPKSYVFNPNASETADAFGKIAQYIVDGSGELNEKSVVRDVVSPYFSLPAGVTASDIKVYTANYTGDDENGVKEFAEPVTFSDADIEIDEKTKTVEVSNFDYSANAVYMTGSDANGKKLIVEIPIAPNPDFLGGDGVFTNEEAVPGLYSKGELVEGFPRPSVSVPVKEVNPHFSGGYVYLSQAAELPHVANVGKFVVGEKEYTIDGVNNAYVDITYTVKDGDEYIQATIEAGTTYKELTTKPPAWTTSSDNINALQVLTQDESYQVRCDVVSSRNPENKSFVEGSANIYVFKPVVTFEDSVIELGQSADYYFDDASEADNYVSVKWVGSDGNEPTGDVLTKLGTAPALEYEYDPAEGAFKKDAEVSVTKVVSRQRGADKDSGFNHEVPEDYEFDLAGEVTFYREACDFEGCGHDAAAAESPVASGKPNFVVHIRCADLVIAKSGLDTALDENQTTIFEVRRLEADPTATASKAVHVADVVVMGNDKVVLKDLPVGTYVVTERTDWSWRYALKSVSVTKGLDGKGSSLDPEISGDACTFVLPAGGATVAFENGRDETRWLDGNCWCSNVFGSVNNAASSNAAGN